MMSPLTITAMESAPSSASQGITRNFGLPCEKTAAVPVLWWKFGMACWPGGHSETKLSAEDHFLEADFG
jgi:hypothetical protein